MELENSSAQGYRFFFPRDVRGVVPLSIIEEVIEEEDEEEKIKFEVKKKKR